MVGGSFAGEWFGARQKFDLGTNFWFGHMGYEHVDLGRFWQIRLFAGLLTWLFLVGRALVPAFKRDLAKRQLLRLLVIVAAAIGLFGFLINPPIARYYMQGLNTTSVHGHTAFFGVYGMLVLGWFAFGLKGGRSLERTTSPVAAFERSAS